VKQLAEDPNQTKWSLAHALRSVIRCCGTLLLLLCGNAGGPAATIQYSTYFGAAGYDGAYSSALRSIQR